MAECIQEGSLSPAISFSKITLEAASALASADYSVTTGTTVTTRTSYSSLHITVDAAIHEIDSGGLLTGWMNDEILSSYLKVRIFQSMDSDLTERILSGGGWKETYEHNAIDSPNVNTLWGFQGRPAVIRQTKSITEILDGREDYRYKTHDSDGNVVWNIPFQFQLKIMGAPPPSI